MVGSGKDKNPWLRIDNDGKYSFLHYHLESGLQQFNDHIPLTSDASLGGIISFSFDKAQEILKWKFSDVCAVTGSDFLGTA